MSVSIGTGITDDLDFEEAFNIIGNFDPVTSQLYKIIHTINNPKDGDIFLYYANKVDDWKADDVRNCEEKKHHQKSNQHDRGLFHLRISTE